MSNTASSSSASSDPTPSSSSSCEKKQDQEQHPLFKMAIVEKVQQKIPIMNNLVVGIGENVSKIKSKNNLLGNTIDLMEQQIYSIASNVVQFVPKQPVELMDQVVCQGFDLIETRVISLAQTTKETRDRIVQVPQVLIGTISHLKNGNPLYQSLDLVLTTAEKTIDYYWPIEHEKYQPKLPIINGGEGINGGGSIIDDGIVTRIIPLGRIIKRLRQFSQHIQIHLMDYADGHQWVGQILIIFNPASIQPSLKPPESATDALPSVPQPPIVDGASKVPPIVVEIGKQIKENTEKLNGDLKNILQETVKKSPISNGSNNHNHHQSPQQTETEKENESSSIMNNLTEIINPKPSPTKPPLSEADLIYQQQVMDVVNQIVNKDSKQINSSSEETTEEEEKEEKKSEESSSSSLSPSKPLSTIMESATKPLENVLNNSLSSISSSFTSPLKANNQNNNSNNHDNNKTSPNEKH